MAEIVHHNRDLALQKYLLLHEQHESLRQHLDELRPIHTSGFANSSPSGSPTRSMAPYSVLSSGQTSPYHLRSNSQSRQQHPHFRRSSVPSAAPTAFLPDGGTALETVLDETTLSELAAEEAKLFRVNEGIKRALTELLNCEATRGDRAFRTWVQCRLMDTEKELRSGRRRRSAPDS